MKPYDLTPILLSRLDASLQWSPSRVVKLLERLQVCVVGSRIDWDKDAGEAWGRLLIARSPSLAVSAVIPLAFAQAPINPDIHAFLESEGVVTITTSNWELREFSADPEIVRRAFKREEWSAAVDPKQFSVAELWWMTV
jgi:hypothetical protein